LALTKGRVAVDLNKQFFDDALEAARRDSVAFAAEQAALRNVVWVFAAMTVLLIALLFVL